MTDKELMQQAFERMTGVPDAWNNPALMQSRNGFIQGWEAARLAQPEQQPVAVIGNWGRVEWLDGVHPQLGDKMYSAPLRREWVGLTEEDEIPWDGVDAKSFARAIEAKLKEKNA